jgi:hypothetical protein
VTPRFRCSACGNVTRFDVVATRRTESFHHFTLGGDLTVEDEKLLEERLEEVSCRWCGATGTAIEHLPAQPVESVGEVSPPVAG